MGDIITNKLYNYISGNLPFVAFFVGALMSARLH